MNNDVRSILVLIVIFLGFFLLGFVSAIKLYNHDTFDCTNTCGGAHYVYSDNACYCEAGK